MTDGEVAQLLEHVLSPDGYVHLVDDFGWTPERYRWWMERLMYTVAYGDD